MPNTEKPFRINGKKNVRVNLMFIISVDVKYAEAVCNGVYGVGLQFTLVKHLYKVFLL